MKLICLLLGSEQRIVPPLHLSHARSQGSLWQRESERCVRICPQGSC